MKLTAVCILVLGLLSGSPKACEAKLGLASAGDSSVSGFGRRLHGRGGSSGGPPPSITLVKVDVDAGCIASAGDNSQAVCCNKQGGTWNNNACYTPITQTNKDGSNKVSGVGRRLQGRGGSSGGPPPSITLVKVDVDAGCIASAGAGSEAVCCSKQGGYANNNACYTPITQTNENGSNKVSGVGRRLQGRGGSSGGPPPSITLVKIDVDAGCIASAGAGSEAVCCSKQGGYANNNACYTPITQTNENGSNKVSGVGRHL